DLRREWRSVRELEGDVALPLRFKRRDIHKNSATRISTLSQTNRQDISRNPKVLNCARKSETVWWNHYRLTLDVDEVLLIKLFWIDDGTVDVCEEFEFVGAANVISIAGRPVGNNAPAINFLHLTRLKGIDHSILFHHTADPLIGLDTHYLCLELC